MRPTPALMDGVMNKCAYLQKALITTMEGVHGEEGSVTLAVMWVYDNAAGADIDEEEPINGAVSPVERLPLWLGVGRLLGWRKGQKASDRIKKIDCFDTERGRQTKQTFSFQRKWRR